jgi:hypothetical protein
MAALKESLAQTKAFGTGKTEAPARKRRGRG